MSAIKSHIIQLIGEYLTGEMEDFRKQELMQWLDEREENRLFFERITRDTRMRQRWSQWNAIDPEAAIDLFDRRTGGISRKRVFLSRWAYAGMAALMVLVMGISFRLLYEWPHPEKKGVETILPGSDKAILKLASGEEMRLEEYDSLQLSLGAGNLLVNKNKQLVYQAKVTPLLQYHELLIPRGGEYQVKLADGTVVHLNSGSSLKYPVAFGEDKREVELKGEAYFEVAGGRTPFYVQVGKIKVKVYGTSFNVDAHRPDRIQTALVKGKVSILLNGKEFVMKPSQLADFDLKTGTLEIKDADLSSSLAWTKGLFVFNNQTLEDIMFTLSLWYDVEVFFQNPSLKELHFTGSVKRYDSIDHILQALSQSVGVKINKQGRTLTISH